MTSHLQYHGISQFEAGASDFVSHTFDLNTCCMYRDIQGVRAIEAQVYISVVTPILFHQWLLVQPAAKAFSLNQPEIFCSTLSLSLSCQPSPLSSLHLSVHAVSMRACIKCICECDDLYQALQSIFSKRYRQIYVRTYTKVE